MNSLPCRCTYLCNTYIDIDILEVLSWINYCRQVHELGQKDFSKDYFTANFSQFFSATFKVFFLVKLAFQRIS